ncbi:MAG: hypothetical protein IPL26_06580 [Leptospiraceae bacterium]|nr:hypothetical protein [Leptospiraceae bacterium]MBK8394900.1 hypothetical protein [Leptospiraceae bacterium]
MSELFKKEDFLTKDAKADDVFRKSYRGMTDEIDRVASEPVTIWAALTKWVYGKIFGDSDHLKEKQDSRDKYRSAAAFGKVQRIFHPEPSDSMTNEEIMDHTQRNFK